MMSAADLWDASLTVADRFKFQPSEIGRLKVSELIGWYDGAVKLYERDSEAYGK